VHDVGPRTVVDEVVTRLRLLICCGYRSITVTEMSARLAAISTDSGMEVDLWHLSSNE
jgi:hypothetical protein